MSWISVTQNQIVTLATLPDLTSYTVEIEVTQAEGIPAELFVFDTSSDEFSSVALVGDLQSWPATKESAIQLGLDFYRSATLQRIFLDKEKAAAFSADVQRRLNLVNWDWSGDQSVQFGGQHIFVYASVI